jgi:hypothetical protein
MVASASWMVCCKVGSLTGCWIVRRSSAPIRAATDVPYGSAAAVGGKR